MGKIYRDLFNQYASEEAKKNGRLDYRGLAKLVGSHILCNNIAEVDNEIWDNVECGSLYSYDYDEAERDYDEYVNDCKENEEEYDDYDTWLEYNESDYEREIDIFQYFLVDDIYWLRKAGELVLYSPKLDCYVWCINHYGTGWDYVLTGLAVTDSLDEAIND